jgi:hypothetical protein
MKGNKVYHQKKGLGQGLFIFSLLFLLMGLMILAWGVWPISTNAKQLTIPAGILPAAPEGTEYASQAEYTMTVDWPIWLRKGEQADLRVTLVETDGTALPDRSAQVVLIEPVLSGLTLEPPGLVQANLSKGQALEESWAINASAEGDFAGKVYVSFGFYDEEAEELVPVPVAVMDIDLIISALWGLDSSLSLWFGLVALVLWGALFILGRTVQGLGR